MALTLNEICRWIDETTLSQSIQVAAWVVPTVQTIHILAIAVVASSALMIDLRLIGVFWANRLEECDSALSAAGLVALARPARDRHHHDRRGAGAFAEKPRLPAQDGAVHRGSDRH